MCGRALACACHTFQEKKEKRGRPLSHGCKNELPAVHGEIRVMEKLFFSQMELKPRGNTAVMSEIAQVHAPTALRTEEKKT